MKRVICFAAAASFLLMPGLSSAVVEFSLSSPAPGLVTIGYNDTDNAGVRGISLKVSLSNGATAVFSDIISIDPAFNVFPDYAYSDLDYEQGEGHPFVNPNWPGALETPASMFGLSMGHLDADHGPAPAVVSNLITFRVREWGTNYSCYISIEADTLRGGVVSDDSDALAVFPSPLLVNIPEPATLILLAAGGLLLRKRK